MEPVGVTLTQQQAMLLLPLLQQIASDSQPTSGMSLTPSTSPNNSSTSSNGSVSPPFFVPKLTDHGYSTDGSESACKYSAEELFQSKSKNSKSSDAHNFCHVSLNIKIIV